MRDLGNKNHQKSEIFGICESVGVFRYSLNFIHVPYSSGLFLSRFGSVSSLQVRSTMIYAASDFYTAVYETIIRDRFDIKKKRKIDSKTYGNRSAVWFSSKERLNLIDLTDGQPTSYGIPTDVYRGSDHSFGRSFSQFVFDKMSDEIDGILYHSRYTEVHCVALYHSRCESKLSPPSLIVPLIEPILTPVLRNRNIRVK